MSSWDLGEIKKHLDDIIEFADALPEKYQVKCFEVLLSKMIDATLQLGVSQPSPSPISPVKIIGIPIDVRAFLAQHSLTEDILPKLFLLREEGVRPIYTLKTNVKAQGQIQLALLIALENALKNIGFEFSIESVRQQCIEHDTYDRNNFITNFRYYINLFKSLDDDKEHVELTPDGKSELAETISEISKVE